ncbi:ABC transporter, partial [Klebsiella variicola]|uniref:NIL domain-containing protein n=2 Tax=Klebsiella/Raoultella group TaxID=2890311 RepID=UPI001BC6D834
PALRDGEQIVTLRFDGSSGREPNLQHIASLLGGDARLLYSNCERIQGRVIGQLQVRLSGPLAASALAQDGWVADSILTHPHQTAETTAS